MYTAVIAGFCALQMLAVKSPSAAIRVCLFMIVVGICGLVGIAVWDERVFRLFSLDCDFDSASVAVGSHWRVLFDDGYFDFVDERETSEELSCDFSAEVFDEA